MKLLTPGLALLFTGFGLPLWAATADAPTTTNAPAPATAAPKMADLFPDIIVAKGKGIEVKRSQLDEMVINIKASAAARGQNIPPEQMALLEQQVLEQLIQVQLLLARATPEDKSKGDELSAKRLADIKTRAGTDEALNRQLKSFGMKFDQLKAKMTEEAIARAVLERELKIQISDDDAKKYYDENPSRFEQPETVRASHILLSTRDMATGTELTEDKKMAKRKQMEDLLKRARAGEDFAKLAKENSEDPGSKEKGGEYTFPRGQMVAEFEAAAFSLNTNQVSDIVTTQFGYHIIKLSEKIPAKKAELTKVAPDLKDMLTQQAIQKQLPDYMAKVRKDAAVEILDEKLKSKEQGSAPTVPPGHPPPEPAKKPEGK